VLCKVNSRTEPGVEIFNPIDALSLEIILLFPSIKLLELSSAPSEFGSVDSPLPELSEKDEEVITKLAKGGTALPAPQVTVLGPRGKENPFE